MKIFFLFLFSLGFISPIFAMDYALCGPAGVYVYIGDSVSKVVSTCGEPVSTREYTEPSYSTVEKTRWTYNLNYAVDDNVSLSKQFVVEFEDEKVTQIFVGGFSYPAINNCGPVPAGRRSIGVGDSMSLVRTKCGNPGLINVVEEKKTEEPSDLTEYIYQSDPSLPPVVIIFENHQVKEFKEGW